ncbi:MAG: DoxX family protein [Armatimonadota bacterium]
MTARESFFQKVAPHVLSLLRIVVALLFMQHGAAKLFGWFADPTSPFTPAVDFAPPALYTQIWLAGFLEFWVGLLFLLGLGTRPVAFLLSGEMAFAYFVVHAPQHWIPIINRGEMAALYCFVFFYFAFAGGGPWSIDRLFRRTDDVAPQKQVESTVISSDAHT